MTEEEFIAKIGWEGGITEALEYGLDGYELEDQESELAKTWRALYHEWQALKPYIAKVEALIPDDEW